MLRETQALFWQLISAPQGVAAALRQGDNKSPPLDEVLRGDERLNAVERLDIYANMYFYRLLDILRGDYEAIVAVVGDDAFHNLVTDYLLACPSQHPSVRNVGERLPQFLDGHPLGIERPWLGDLGRLVRARLEVFDGPDADALTLDELRTLEPDAFVALPLPIVPSHRRLDLRFAVDDTWRAADDDERGDEPPPPPAAEPQSLIVWRHELTVYHRRLEPLEQRTLASAAAGAPFGVICDLVAETVPLDEAGPAAFQLLARWVQDGLIARAPTS